MSLDFLRSHPMTFSPLRSASGIRKADKMEDLRSVLRRRSVRRTSFRTSGGQAAAGRRGDSGHGLERCQSRWNQGLRRILAPTGWNVFLDLNQNGNWDTGEFRQATDASGNFAFTNLAPGQYVVATDLPSGAKQTYPATSATPLYSRSESNAQRLR